jgi:hypothetical protein
MIRTRIHSSDDHIRFKCATDPENSGSGQYRLQVIYHAQFRNDVFTFVGQVPGYGTGIPL